jgi:hypothetical protein
MARVRRLPVALEVKTVRETRDRIPEFLRETRTGSDVKPEVFGSHRKPEGVLLPYSVYTDLLEELDDLSISRTVEERDAVRGEKFIEIDDAMRALGLDPGEHDIG